MVRRLQPCRPELQHHRAAVPLLWQSPDVLPRRLPPICGDSVTRIESSRPKTKQNKELRPKTRGFRNFSRHAARRKGTRCYSDGDERDGNFGGYTWRAPLANECERRALELIGGVPARDERAGRAKKVITQSHWVSRGWTTSNISPFVPGCS